MLFSWFDLQLSFDLVEEWIKKNPKASICTSEGIKLFRDIANFQDYHGLPEFRKVYIHILPFNVAKRLGASGALGAHLKCLGG